MASATLTSRVESRLLPRRSAKARPGCRQTASLLPTSSSMLQPGPRTHPCQNRGNPLAGNPSAPAVTPELAPNDSNVLSLFNDGVLLEIYRHARFAYPEECCGMILASGVRPCRNAQNHLHTIDPATFPQTAADAFCLEVGDQILLAESMNSRDPVRAIYHSHPGGGLGFSDLDRSSMLLDGRPIYARLHHLVVDCRSDHIRGAGLYAFVRGNFREVARLSGRWW